MSRTELGALVSRALAVWNLCGAVSNLPELIPGASKSQQPVMYSFLALTLLVQLGISALLWFKSASFGTWIGPDPESQIPDTGISKAQVSTALIQMASGYWLIWSLARIGSSAAVNSPTTLAIIDTFEAGHGFYWGQISLCLVSLVLLFNAKAVSRTL